MASATRSRRGWIDGAIGGAVLLVVAIAAALGAVEVAMGALIAGIVGLGLRASFTPPAPPSPALDDRAREDPAREDPAREVLEVDLAARARSSHLNKT